MRKWLALSAVLFLAGLLCLEQSRAQLTITGVGGGFGPSGAGGYTGPADIVASPLHWYGFRAMSSADRGNPLMRVCNVADAACGDLSSDATTGALVISTIGGSSCSIVICTIERFYNRASSANSIQTTIANRPTLIVDCGDGKPCAAFAPIQYTLASVTAISQPFTMSAVAIRTGANTSFGNIFSGFDGSAGAVLFFNNSVNQIFIYSPGSASFGGTATDNAWHAVQAVFNGSSSVININNTETTGTIGTGATAAALAIAANTDTSSPLTGRWRESGVWSGSFSAGNRTAVCHNQFVFWGTSVSC